MGDISSILCYNKTMEKRICFIGHRKIGYGKIREKLLQAVENEIKNGCKIFLMGTHGEFDEMALSVCRELRKTYKDIRIQVVITSLHKVKKQILYDDEYGQETFIPYDDVETVMYDIEDEHYKRQIIVSNRQMIDDCDALIAYVNRKNTYSGAKLALNYAKRKGLPIINLYDEKDEPTYGMTAEQKKKYWDEIWERIRKNKTGI